MKRKKPPVSLISDQELELLNQLASLNDNRKSSAKKAELLNDVYTGLDEAITGKTIPASQMTAALDENE